MPNYARIGAIKDRLADAGVREVDLQQFEIEYERGDFDLADITPEWIAEQKEKRPLRFIGGRSEEAELYLKAFGPCPNVTAQGQVLKQCGGDLEAANQIAARYGGQIGSTKPGIDPDPKDDKTESTNPWAPTFRGNAEAERIKVIKTFGTVAATKMAAKFGRDIGGRLLKSRAA